MWLGNHNLKWARTASTAIHAGSFSSQISVWCFKASLPPGGAHSEATPRRSEAGKPGCYFRMGTRWRRRGFEALKTPVQPLNEPPRTGSSCPSRITTNKTLCDVGGFAFGRANSCCNPCLEAPAEPHQVLVNVLFCNFHTFHILLKGVLPI